MQISKINSTPFGSGVLVVSKNEGKHNNKNAREYIQAKNIRDIRKEADHVQIIYGIYSKELGMSQNFEVEVRNTPLDTILAAYTAAMTAPTGSFIDISKVS